MAKMNTVNVVRGEENQLILQPERFDLCDGDWVQWKFPEDLPSDQFGMIFFQSRLGPFHSLRSYSNKEVLGKGNVGVKSSYNYTAMILQPGQSGDQPGSVPKGTGTIDNMAAEPNTTPEIYVTYIEGSPLQVSPDPVGLNVGDTATWYITGLPADHFADFWFFGMSSVSGPFTAFYACGGDGPVAVRASGTNFARGELALIKQFSYLIEIRDAQGRVIVSHEPGIDNLGPPPG